MKAIVIVANGWNAGWLGSYGNEWLLTPHLDHLAAESVVFDQHFAVNPSPEEWRRSLSSGCFEFAGDSARQPSLIQLLRQSGIRTVRLADLRSQPEIAGDDWDLTITTHRDEEAPPGEALTAAIAGQLVSLAKREHWLLWIETDRLIPPWSVSLDYFDRYAEEITAPEEGESPQPWDDPPVGPIVLNDCDFDRLHGTFASVVTEWDVDLGRWFELFRKHGLAESALWMVTAGHGLSLGEHNWIGPESARPYEEMSHLPLIIRMPGGEQAGRRVSELTGSIDILPTLLGVAGQGGLHGHSLLPLMHGSQKPVHSYLCQTIRGEAALRTAEWAFLHGKTTGALLFRKPEDRWEVNDSRMHHLEWAEHLQSTLQEFIHSAPDERSTPPELKHYSDIVAPVVAGEETTIKPSS